MWALNDKGPSGLASILEKGMALFQPLAFPFLRSIHVYQFGGFVGLGPGAFENRPAILGLNDV